MGYPGVMTGTNRPVFSGGGSIDTTEPQSLGGGVPDSVVLGNRIVSILKVCTTNIIQCDD